MNILKHSLYLFTLLSISPSNTPQLTTSPPQNLNYSKSYLRSANISFAKTFIQTILEVIYTCQQHCLQTTSDIIQDHIVILSSIYSQSNNPDDISLPLPDEHLLIKLHTHPMHLPTEELHDNDNSSQNTSYSYIETYLQYTVDLIQLISDTLFTTVSLHPTSKSTPSLSIHKQTLFISHIKNLLTEGIYTEHSSITKQVKFFHISKHKTVLEYQSDDSSERTRDISSFTLNHIKQLYLCHRIQNFYNPIPENPVEFLNTMHNTLCQEYTSNHLSHSQLTHSNTSSTTLSISNIKQHITNLDELFIFLKLS